MVCCGDRRTRLTWQNAQFSPTRSKPMCLRVMPTGSSCPRSQFMPRLTQPPGAGRYSGNIFGRTMKIQKGVPCSPSVPIDAYMKDVRGLLCTQAGSGRVRKKFQWTITPRTRASTRTTAIVVIQWRRRCSEPFIDAPSSRLRRRRPLRHRLPQRQIEQDPEDDAVDQRDPSETGVLARVKEQEEERLQPVRDDRHLRRVLEAFFF